MSQYQVNNAAAMYLAHDSSSQGSDDGNIEHLFQRIPTTSRFHGTKTTQYHVEKTIQDAIRIQVDDSSGAVYRLKLIHRSPYNYHLCMLIPIISWQILLFLSSIHLVSLKV
jgi:hypothetical protein